MKQIGSILQRGMLLAIAVGPMLILGCQNTPQDNILFPIVKDWMPPTPQQAARDMFNVYDPDKRRESIALISASKFGGETPYVRAYRLLVDDGDATVRAAAIQALGLHGNAEDVKTFIRYLTDPVSFVRWEAAQALQKIHDSSAVGPLIQVLANDEDADVRMAAGLAMGQYAENRVFAALVGALDDSDFGVVQASQYSLATLTGYDFGADGALWLIWAERNPGKLFEKQKEYTWQPFNKPNGFWDDVQFWRQRVIKPPQSPTGLEATSNAATTQPRS